MIAALHEKSKNTWTARGSLLAINDYESKNIERKCLNNKNCEILISVKAKVLKHTQPLKERELDLNTTFQLAQPSMASQQETI